MTDLSNATIPTRRPGVLAQQMKPEDASVVLLNPKTGEYYALESVGTRVWELCDGKNTISAIAAIVSQEFEAPPEDIESDVLSLVKELMDEQLVAAAP